MKLEKFALKKFLCRFPLQLGGYVVGIVFIAIMVILIIITLVQIINMQKNVEVINKYPWRNAYGYTITGLLYYGVMLGLNILFEWGIYKSNKTIILIWVVITGLWIFLALCGLLSMVVTTSEDPDMDKAHWILRLVFGLLGIGALTYGLLVGFSIWIALKKSLKYYAPSIPPSLTPAAPKPPALKSSPAKPISQRKQTPRSTPRSTPRVTPVPSDTEAAPPNTTVQIAATTPPPPQQSVPHPMVSEAQPPQQIHLALYPQETMPYQTMPQETMQHVTMPRETMQHVTMPRETMQHVTMPHETMQHVTMPHETMQHVTMPHEAMPHVMMPHESIPAAQIPVQPPLVINPPTTHHSQKPQAQPPRKMPEPLLNEASTDSFSPDSQDDVTRRRSRK